MDNKFDATLGEYREADFTTAIGDASYARLNGSNQPFTDDIEVRGDGSASVTVNAVPAGQGGIDEYNKLNLALDVFPFVDTEITPKAVINNNVILATDRADFNGSSAYFSIPDSNDFYFGTDPVTFDAYVTFDTLPSNGSYQMLYMQRANNENFVLWGVYNNAGTYLIYIDSYSSNVRRAYTYSTISLSTGTEYHLAFTRVGNNFTHYRNGTALAFGGGSTTAVELPNIASDPNIGRSPAGSLYFDGKMRWFRVSKGIARWTTNFTPPTAPYDTAVLTPTPQLILKGSGVQKAILKSDGSDSDKIKLLDKDNVELVTIDQTTGDTVLTGEITTPKANVKDIQFDTLTNATVLATDSDGKIIEGSFPAESDTLDTVTTRGATTTNRITTGNHTVTDDGSASVTVNAVPDETYGTGGDTVTNITVGSDTYRVHKFTTVGDSTFVAPTPARNVEVLVVGGGGGGGGYYWAGGGGAGGVKINNAYSATAGQSISVTVGNFGAGGTTTTAGLSGGNSVFGTLTAIGGGYGQKANAGIGGAGGSGGGNGSLVGSLAQGTDGQGNDGGDGNTAVGNGGGGGGCSSAGSSASASKGGDGGAGFASEITGTLVNYACGGGGGTYNGSGTYGLAGGDTAGHGGKFGGITATSAVANTGSGGGGTGNGISGTGGNGGSGIVIVRYIISSGSTVAEPQIVLQGTGVQKAILKTDGADSDKIKLLDKDNVEIITVEQTTGKVGIGTTNPDRKLTVSDASGSAQIMLSYDAEKYAEIRGGSTGALYFTSSKGFTYFNSAGKDNKFYAFDYSSTGSPYLYLSAHTLRLNAGMVAGWGAVNLNDNGDSFLTGGNVGIGTTSPTAVLHLKAGTSTAYTSPLKFTSGTLLETAEAGALEFLSDDFFATITTGAARKGIILDDGSRLTSGKIPVATTNGRLVDLTAQDTEADLKVDYTSGDLDTEAEVITAINATNAKINSIIEKLKALGLLATS